MPIDVTSNYIDRSLIRSVYVPINELIEIAFRIQFSKCRASNKIITCDNHTAQYLIRLDYDYEFSQICHIYIICRVDMRIYWKYA